MKVAYVHVDPDGRFTFHDVDGSATTIAQAPVEVDAKFASYLDTVPFVKRAKKASGEEA